MIGSSGGYLLQRKRMNQYGWKELAAYPEYSGGALRLGAPVLSGGDLDCAECVCLLSLCLLRYVKAWARGWSWCWALRYFDWTRFRERHLLCRCHPYLSLEIRRLGSPGVTAHWRSLNWGFDEEKRSPSIERSSVTRDTRGKIWYSLCIFEASRKISDKREARQSFCDRFFPTMPAAPGPHGHLHR